MAKAPKKYGLGIGLLVVGIIFVAANWYLYQYQNYYFPKFLIVGIITFFLGIAFTLFPGAHAGELDSWQYLKYKFKNTPVLIKLIWLAFLALSVVAVFLVIDHYHLKIV